MAQAAPKYKLGQIVTVQPQESSNKVIPYKGVIRTLPKIDGIVHERHNFIYGVYSKSHGTIHPVSESQILKAEDPTPAEPPVPPSPSKYEGMKKDELLDLVFERKIDIEDGATKAQIVEALVAADKA